MGHVHARLLSSSEHRALTAIYADSRGKVYFDKKVAHSFDRHTIGFIPNLRGGLDAEVLIDSQGS